MSSTENFQAFYEQQLVPHLRKLEFLRKRVAFILWVSIVFGIASLFAAIYYLGGFNVSSLENINNSSFIIALVLLVVWAVAGTLIYKKVFEKKLENIRQKFKRSVIDDIAKYVDPKLEYFEHKSISQDEYEASKLFPPKAHWYFGEDYMVGKDGETPYKFSEVRAQYTIKDHRGRKAFYTIFRGLFFIADINTNFEAETVILPDTAKKLFGKLGEAIQKRNIFREKLVKINNETFSKEFVVYSNDENATRDILNENLLNRITQFKKKTGHKVYLSFIGSKVNVAIYLDKDLFEPPVFRNMLNYTSIHENYKYLSLVTGIVEDLELQKQ